MSRKVGTRVAALVLLVIVSYGIGVFRGNQRLELVMEAAHVAADMSGSWERTTNGAVHVVVQHYEHHAWYVLVGAYVDPTTAVQARLGSQVARQIRSHGDERDWVLYTVLDDGTVLPGVDVWMKSYEQAGILGSHNVVIVRNSGDRGHGPLEILPAQGVNRDKTATFEGRSRRINSVAASTDM